jgi:uncharacterized protein with von Willebrand factor type A (vWA) domain
MSKLNVYLLLDRSGSMSNKMEEAVGSINSYVKELDQSANIFLASFDSNGYDVVRNTSAKKFEPVSYHEVSPRGGTPLYDAAARLMHRAIDDNNSKTILVIMTDGEENSSKHFNNEHVKSLVNIFNEKKWEVIFLGSEFKEVYNQSASFGVDHSKTVNRGFGSYGLAMSSLASKSVAYGASGQSINFTTAEQSEFAKSRK